MPWRANGPTLSSSRFKASARAGLALNLGVELGHDPVELPERAAKALTVLLREFGRLRTDQSGQHGRETPCSLGPGG